MASSTPSTSHQLMRPPPVFNLRQLPNEILFHVLYKLPNVALCRMRVTCSLLDKVVERSGKKLSQRPALGLPLIFMVDKNNNIKVGKFGESPRHFIAGNDLAKRLNAISVHSLYVHNYHLNGCCQIMANTLKTFTAPCLFAQIMGFKTEYIVEMANHLKVRQEIMAYSVLEEPERFFKIMGQANSREKITISFHDTMYSRVDGLFEQVKNFGKFYAAYSSVDATTLNELLWTMYSADDVGLVERISLLFHTNRQMESKGFPYVTSDRTAPPNRILWDSASLPEEKQKNIPQCIRLIKMKTKLAVVVELKQKDPSEHGLLQRHENIYLVNKDEREVLDIVLSTLEIREFTETQREDYFSAILETKMDILREAVLAREPIKYP